MPCVYVTVFDALVACPSCEALPSVSAADLAGGRGEMLRAAHITPSVQPQGLCCLGVWIEISYHGDITSGLPAGCESTTQVGTQE